MIRLVQTLSFLLLLAAMSCRGQEARLHSMVQRLQAFGERIPQEKVYVHMDNTSYFLGDTIWFAAYTRQTNTANTFPVKEYSLLIQTI